jgi:hypothetical protein
MNPDPDIIVTGVFAFRYRIGGFVPDLTIVSVASADFVGQWRRVFLTSPLTSFPVALREEGTTHKAKVDRIVRVVVD